MSSNDCDELISEFDNWLRTKKNMRNKPNISKERNRYIQYVKDKIEEFKMDPSNRDNCFEDSLLEYFNGEIKFIRETSDKRANTFILEFLKSRSSYDEQEEESETITENEPEQEGTERKIIGRVAITMKSQARPTEFEFWSEDTQEFHVEIGSVVSVISKSEKENVSIIGMVIDIYNTSALESPIEDFYSTGYGNPNVELATVRPIVKVSKVSVIWRSDGRFEPPGGNWPVYFASSNEILTAYGAEIPDQYAVLAGFTWDDKKKPVPIYLDSRYLLGYEGAHVNISGASGLATKTSYALFLINSIISTSLSNVDEKSGDSVAAVLFNVKEADLMRIDDGPENEDQLFNITKENEKNLWERSIDEGVDPFEFRNHMKFFAPADPYNPQKLLTFRDQVKQTKKFSFGLYDLIDEGGASLYSLFEPDDISDEKAAAFISSIYDELNSENGIILTQKPNNFQGLIDGIKSKLNPKTGNKQQDQQWIEIGFARHHSATVNKIINRLNQAVNHRLKGLILKDEKYGEPINIKDLKPGDVWVIDISKLHTTGQRLTFTQVYNTINRILEAKRNKENELKVGTTSINLKNFPSRVIVFVDELNKFAPSGKYGSELKSHIVDITAR
ncbi:MAG: hypothetical protein ACP5OE_09470, partial [Thermodesulfobium sp.]